MGKVKDIYELVLIAPIMRATNLKMVRARARAARAKFDRHCKISGGSFAVAASVCARITVAETVMANKLRRAKA